MGKTNAERQRLYRQRRDADPSRREEYLHTEQARYIKLKRLGVRKLISEQSDKDKKITRRQWRGYQRSSRQGKQEVSTVLAAIGTPPTSPDQVVLPENRRERGRKQVRRDRARCYQELKRVRLALEKEKKSTGKDASVPQNLGKKDVLGMLNLLEQRPEICCETFKYRHQSRKCWNCTTSLHRTSDRNTSSQNPREREQKAIAHCVTGSIIKRYKLQRYTEKTFVFSRRRQASNPKS